MKHSSSSNFKIQDSPVQSKGPSILPEQVLPTVDVTEEPQQHSFSGAAGQGSDDAGGHVPGAGRQGRREAVSQGLEGSASQCHEGSASQGREGETSQVGDTFASFGRDNGGE